MRGLITSESGILEWLSCLILAPPPCFCMKWRSCSCQNLGVLSDTSITPHLPYYLVLKHLLPNIFPVELVMLWPLLPPQSWSLLPLAQVTATIPVNLESHQSILHTVAGITFLKWKLHHDALPVQNSEDFWNKMRKRLRKQSHGLIHFDFASSP